MKFAMRNEKMETNRVFTKQDRKRLRDSLERGLDPSVADDVLALIRTTHDMDILERCFRKVNDERKAMGCDPDKLNSEVIPRDRMAELLAEAIAESNEAFS